MLACEHTLSNLSSSQQAFYLARISTRLTPSFPNPNPRKNCSNPNPSPTSPNPSPNPINPNPSPSPNPTQVGTLVDGELVCLDCLMLSLGLVIDSPDVQKCVALFPESAQKRIRQASANGRRTAFGAGSKLTKPHSFEPYDISCIMYTLVYYDVINYVSLLDPTLDPDSEPKPLTRCAGGCVFRRFGLCKHL